MPIEAVELINKIFQLVEELREIIETTPLAIDIKLSK